VDDDLILVDLVGQLVTKACAVTLGCYSKSRTDR
jgi:hypothetical protein